MTEGGAPNEKVRREVRNNRAGGKMASLEQKPTGRRIQIQALVKEFHAPGLGLIPEPGQNH